MLMSEDCIIELENVLKIIDTDILRLAKIRRGDENIILIFSGTVLFIFCYYGEKWKEWCRFLD